MLKLDSMGLRCDGRQLLVLDQRSLPDREEWIECRDPAHMTQLIKQLSTRGAPLIGVSAAMSLAMYAQGDVSKDQIASAARMLRDARPTAVNLMWAIDRLLRTDLSADQLAHEAQAIADEDVAMCQAMGNNGAALVNDGENILTHCNAGALATAGIGTALGMIRRAHQQGKHIHVYVDETRPLLQGARLTAWELERDGIPCTVICDNMAAMLMRQEKIQRVIVGADRIAANGDFANKIGTYGVAVLARQHDIPFHVVAPESTVDPECPDGESIPIELRAEDEVRGAAGHFGTVRWAPADVPAYNPAFDVTPAELVTATVLDSGVYFGGQVREDGLIALLHQGTVG